LESKVLGKRKEGSCIEYIKYGGLNGRIDRERRDKEKRQFGSI